MAQYKSWATACLSSNYGRFFLTTLPEPCQSFTQYLNLYFLAHKYKLNKLKTELKTLTKLWPLFCQVNISYIMSHFYLIKETKGYAGPCLSIKT